MWRDAAGVARAPFEFERKREVGARDGLSDVVANVGSIGWNSVIGLPREIAGAVGKSPSREEPGWLLAAVQRDPWEAARLFGWFHAFLLFLNLVPIPPLDGFQLLCLGVESAAGRPHPRRGLAVVRKVGFVLLAVWLGLNLFLILRDAAVAAF